MTSGNTRSFTLVALACLILLLPATVALGKDSTIDTDPLRPADTSSPRATLSTFLADSSLAIEDLRQNRANEKTYRAFLRASQTLDFSATPEGDSWFVRNRCIAQLQELLARIELP
ncbi:MAG TPA: hypothetical protein DIC36_04940, partial [Gammaproteobacteria bacterium]|nr:hypothetical protein [Gammaproteobacteria bacterium]